RMLFDPRTGVPYRDDDVEPVVAQLRSRPDLDQAAVRHRVARVDDEVQQHLGQAVGRDVYAGELRLEHGDELDACGQQPPREPLDVPDGLIRVDGLGRLGGAAGEGCELARQRARLRGGALDLQQPFAQLVVP